MGTISARMFQWKLVSYLSMSTRHYKLVIDQCQTNGHDLMTYWCQPDTSSNQYQTKGHNFSLYVAIRSRHLPMSTLALTSNRSIPNQWVQYCQLSMSTWTQAWNPMGTISARMFEQEPNYYLAEIKAKSQYQPMYLRFICHKLKFNRSNYNSYVVINITWLRQSGYEFTAQLK